MSRFDQRIVLVRHGETEWSLSRRHTSVTDLPLTEGGRQEAERVGDALVGRRFALVLSSPLRRARDTARLAGFGEQVELDPDLLEWRYGRYEGRTTAEIWKEAPGWTVFTHPCPDGETAEQVAARVDRVIARLRQASGDVALFAHGHVLRVLGARWLGLDPRAGRHLVLSTGTVSVLGYEHEAPAILSWNAPVLPEPSPVEPTLKTS